MTVVVLMVVMVVIVVESGGANGGGGVREHCGFGIDRQHMCDTRPSTQGQNTTYITYYKDKEGAPTWEEWNRANLATVFQ